MPEQSYAESAEALITRYIFLFWKEVEECVREHSSGVVISLNIESVVLDPNDAALPVRGKRNDGIAVLSAVPAVGKREIRSTLKTIAGANYAQTCSLPAFT